MKQFVLYQNGIKICKSSNICDVILALCKIDDEVVFISINQLKKGVKENGEQDTQNKTTEIGQKQE